MSKIYRDFFGNKGSVLMEFILVCPLYFALWGGLFTLGELLLLNNRITVADRNMGYVVPYLLNENVTPDQRAKILRVLINLSGKNVSHYDDADLGYAKTSPVPSLIGVSNTETYSAFTRWGRLYTTALSVGGVKFPSFISGMLVAISVISGDEVRDDDFIYTLGELLPNQLGRSYVIIRNNAIDYRDAKNQEEMLEKAFELSTEDVLGSAPNNQSNTLESKQENYERVFGTFFNN